MVITVDNRGGTAQWDARSIQELAAFALEHMDVPDDCEVSVSLVDIDEIRALNREYRGKDAPTDVLSFECDGLDGETFGNGPVMLGDVVISMDVVDEQRSRFGTTLEQEASLMLVHSLLHLLGYDHMEEQEAEEMEAIEKEILDAYGMCGIR